MSSEGTTERLMIQVDKMRNQFRVALWGVKDGWIFQAWPIDSEDTIVDVGPTTFKEALKAGIDALMFAEAEQEK